MRLILTRKTMIFIFEGWPRSAPQQETFRGYQANAEFIRQEEMSCIRQFVRLESDLRYGVDFDLCRLEFIPTRCLFVKEK